MEFIEDRAHRKKRLKKLPKVTDAVEVKSIKKKPIRGNAYQTTRTGYRDDLGVTLRSAWEADFLRVLEVHGIPWEYEPTTFTFPIKRGTKAYLVDFYLPETDDYIEIKGWFDQKSKVKMKRFKKYYPEEFSKLTMIIGRGSKDARDFCETLGVPNVIYFQDIRDEYKPKIANWESK